MIAIADAALNTYDFILVSSQGTVPSGLDEPFHGERPSAMQPAHGGFDPQAGKKRTKLLQVVT